MTLQPSPLARAFSKVYRNGQYRFWMLLLGILSLPVVGIVYLLRKRDSGYDALYAQCDAELRQQGRYDAYLAEAKAQTRRKQEFFNLKQGNHEDAKDVKVAEQRFHQEVVALTAPRAEAAGQHEVTFQSVFVSLLANPLFLVYSVIVSLPMYLMILIHQMPVAKYISARLIMMIFVVLGVIFFVFTILYISPMQPAENLLGDQATQAQLDAFNATYGLDQPYLVRLGDAFRDILTFDLGRSYQGEEIMLSMVTKFPITVRVALLSMAVSLIIALPAGILSAIKQYSSFDYIAMFFALIGLSIPNFWLGLILILNFSINMGVLPATFLPDQWVSFVMPAIVLGTGMSASVARMTRSSILEVKNAEYILTARAKGLSENRVVFKHILRNALIPIVTVIGLQFGAMLGGSSVVEKVFNINGLGSWIVDKQFIPDTPVVLSGVVYIAVVISIANLIVDLLYTALDPRIKT